MIDAIIRWTLSRSAPLSTGQRVDLELLTRRTIEVFGSEWLRSRELRTENFDVSPQGEGLSELVGRVAQQLGVSDQLVGDSGPTLKCEVVPTEKLQLMFDYKPPVDGGGALLEVPQHVLEDPLRCTTTLAAGVARHVWQQLGTRDLDRDLRTASLLPVLGGMGPLIADAALYDDHWQSVGYSGWTLSRMGQYNAMEIGYVMALRARLIDAEDSTWLETLRLDANATARQARRHFNHRDSQQLPLLIDAKGIPSATRDPKEFTRWISSGPPEFALSSARVLNHRFRTEQARIVSTELTNAILNAVKTRDIDLQVALTQLIGACTIAPGLAEAPLLRLSLHKHPSVALAALESADSLGISPARFVASAKRLLLSESFDLLPVLRWVGQSGTACRQLAPLLCEHLREALKWEDEAGISATAEALCRIHEDPIEVARQQIKNAEQYEKARHHLESALGHIGA